MSHSPYKVLFEKEGAHSAEITVGISLYNYETYVVEALQSVHGQDLPVVDLVVVDDKSTDDSAGAVLGWLTRNGSRFNSMALVQHRQNFGLAAARNTAFSLATTRFVFVLDADNILYPRCLQRLLEGIQETDAAFCFPILEKFGSETGLLGTDIWSLQHLANGNYIDAMALIRKSAWQEVGGYSKMEITGWEDYELWCKFVDNGLYGIQVPEILARYRVHPSSMLRTITDARFNATKMLRAMKRMHPWIRVPLHVH